MIAKAKSGKATKKQAIAAIKKAHVAIKAHVAASAATSKK
jgi:hypothetical protein